MGIKPVLFHLGACKSFFFSVVQLADPFISMRAIVRAPTHCQTYANGFSRMISAREKRIQLEVSLEREENTLKQIKASMAQSNATTQAMSRSVTVKILK